MIKQYREVLEKWGYSRGRPFIDYVVKKLEENWSNKCIFIVEAPTGYGKTTISGTIALQSFKVVVAFPLRSLLEQQYLRFMRIIDRDLLGKRYMHNPESRYLIKPVTLTTIDTFSLTLFGISPEDIDKVVKYWSGTCGGSLGHYLFSWASTMLSDIVLDEVHLLADSTKSINFLIALLKIVLDNDQRVVLMSATIPKVLEALIMEYLGEKTFNEKALIIRFSKDMDDEFTRERTFKNYKISVLKVNEDEKYRRIKSLIMENMNRYSRIITVFNTVADAVKFYDEIKDLENYFDKIVLIHSRFCEKDRRDKINEINEINEKLRRSCNCLEHLRMNRHIASNLEDIRYIIVTTQVIEAGIDISSNLLVTELAPANTLIQRFGRFLRYDYEREGLIYVWYEAERDGNLKRNRNLYRVYDWDLTNRTLKYLLEYSNKLNIHVPETIDDSSIGYNDMLNKIYTYSDFKIRMKDIEELIRILLSLEEESLKALDVFINLEGSFVRDEFQIPVIPWKLLSECFNSNRVLDEEKLLEYILPISIDYFNSLRKRKNVKGYIASKKQAEGNDEELKLFIDLKSNIPGESRKLLKFMMKESIISFIIDTEYDRNRGLILYGGYE
ncbi:MAG: CRISPR-associated helicase Cas3' [Candidatus Methanomethylicia archaeon]